MLRFHHSNIFLTSNKTIYFIRLLNVASTNCQYAQTKIEEECPVHVHRSVTKNDNYHCSLEEWENAKSFSEIPGPKALPIIGNTWRFLPKIGIYGNVLNDFVGTFQNINNHYGDIVKMEKVMGRKTNINLFDPANIEKVYKLEGIIPEREIFPSATYYRENMRQDIFQHAKGLVTSNGKEWYDFRNKVNAIMMQPKMVKQYVHPVDDIAKEYIDRIKTIRGKNNKLQADFWKETNKWAMESTTYLAMNSRLGCLQADLSNDSLAMKMIRLTEDVFTYIAKLDFMPSIWRYVSTPTYRKAMKLNDEHALMAKSLIEKAIKELNEKKSDNQIDQEPSVLEKLLKIDVNVAIVMTLDMLLAGVDTTSTALINALYHLAMNKEKQEILRKEILSLLPDSNSVLTTDILNSMFYLKACIKEAARIYPVTPGTMRITTKNMVLSGYKIPKGTIIFFFHMIISQQEKYFMRPKEFLPERWLRENIGTDISYKNAHPFCAMHFGFGARSCIGRRFAELEIEVALINFIRNFNLSWDGPPPQRKSTSINYLSGPYNFVFEDLQSI